MPTDRAALVAELPYKAISVSDGGRALEWMEPLWRAVQECGDFRYRPRVSLRQQTPTQVNAVVAAVHTAMRIAVEEAAALTADDATREERERLAEWLREHGYAMQQRADNAQDGRLPLDIAAGVIRNARAESARYIRAATLLRGET